MAEGEFPVPASPIDLVLPGGLPPEDLDPLADGILMAHQVAWVADKSDVKIAEKGRRTGITFAEALDDTLIAASKRSAGGDNVFYVGDSKDKALEFCGVVARFARHLARELVSVNEFMFDDIQPDGTTNRIAAYRVKFASGFQVVGLSSRPAAIRGLQGIVVIDEAAFHQDVRAVIDAVGALLIWGGKIRIISTHNTSKNPFNELVRETREGRNDYSLHRISFDDAVGNGLYERVCLINGDEPTPEGKTAWYRKVRRVYGTRTAAMREELDVIPREGSGVAIPLAWIEACSEADHQVLRWEAPAEDFTSWPEDLRRAEMERYLEREVQPVLDLLQRMPSHAGLDFGMKMDRTCLSIFQTAQDLTRHVPLIIELDRCPYDQQKQLVKYVLERLPRFSGAIFDANGNGMPLAQEIAQTFGERLIQQLHPNVAWYREHGPKFRAAFQDGTIRIPADVTIRDDLRELAEIDGVIHVPSDVRRKGDGGENPRHADAAMSLYYGHAASQNDAMEYGYEGHAGTPGSRGFGSRPADIDDDGEDAFSVAAWGRRKGAW